MQLFKRFPLAPGAACNVLGSDFPECVCECRVVGASHLLMLFCRGCQDPRVCGKGGNCPWLLLNLIVVGEESFLCVHSLLLPDVMVLMPQNTLWGKSKMSSRVSLWPWKSFYLLKSTGAWTFMWTSCVWFRLFWGIPDLASSVLLEVIALSLPARNMYPHNYLPETS